MTDKSKRLTAADEKSIDLLMVDLWIAVEDWLDDDFRSSIDSAAGFDIVARHFKALRADLEQSAMVDVN